MSVSEAARTDRGGYLTARCSLFSHPPERHSSGGRGVLPGPFARPGPQEQTADDRMSVSEAYSTSNRYLQIGIQPLPVWLVQNTVWPPGEAPFEPTIGN
jgi:hypothetical protein